MQIRYWTWRLGPYLYRNESRTDLTARTGRCCRFRGGELRFAIGTQFMWTNFRTDNTKQHRIHIPHQRRGTLCLSGQHLSRRR
jgi:hypothetical protein